MTFKQIAILIFAMGFLAYTQAQDSLKYDLLFRACILANKRPEALDIFQRNNLPIDNLDQDIAQIMLPVGKEYLAIRTTMKKRASYIRGLTGSISAFLGFIVCSNITNKYFHELPFVPKINQIWPLSTVFTIALLIKLFRSQFRDLIVARSIGAHMRNINELKQDILNLPQHQQPNANNHDQ